MNAVHGAFDGLMTCKQHECPYIKIDSENYACVLEYVDDLVGNCEVLSVENDPLCIEFDSNYKIPLICSCCGKDRAYVVKGAENVLIGKYLVCLSYAPEDGDQHEGIGLHFSDTPEGEPVDEWDIFIHMDSIRRISKIKE